MASAFKQYKKMKTVDKILIPSALVVLLGMAAFLSGTLNPITTVLAFLAFYGLIHFAITKSSGTAALIVLLVQTVVMFPVIFVYGALSAATSGLENINDSTILIGALYTFAATYLTAWSTWKWSSGRWWVRLILGFAAIDFIAPLIAVSVDGLNIYVAMTVTALIVAAASIPWSRIRTDAIVDLPANIQEDKATDAMHALVQAIDGAEVTKVDNAATDFTVKSGRRTFRVFVLGKQRDLKVAGNSVQYGTANLKPLLYRIAEESPRKKDIPVIVNYSDSSRSFVEIESSLKADKRRGRHVILTTPRKLVELIKESA